MEPLQLGIIGCGYWGKNYVRSAVELPDVDLAACCDTDLSILEKIKENYKGIHCTADADELFKNPDIEAVCIVTPAATHAELTRKALEAGKHVLVEKPFATDEDEALRLVELAEKTGRILMVGHIYVYHPASEKLRAMAIDGTLGKIYNINCRRTSLGPMRPDVNVAWDLTVHDLYFIMHILGESPSRVMSLGISPGDNSREEAVEVMMEFPSGTIAHLHASWLYPPKQREFVITGSNASVIFDEINYPGELLLIERGRAKNSECETERVPGEGDAEKRIDTTGMPPLKNMIREFAVSVRTGKKPPSSGVEGLEVVRAMKAIERSLAEGGKAVEVG